MMPSATTYEPQAGRSRCHVVLRGTRIWPSTHAGRPPDGYFGICLDRTTARPVLHGDHLRPRGFGRSTIDDPDQDGQPDLVAEDMRRVLEAVGKVPAHVFGSSGGAVTGLALVTRYPDLVGTLIAHEAPLALLLPEAKEASSGMHEIYDTYRHLGISAAWEKFSSFTGMDTGPRDDNVDPEPPSAEEVATSERFFGHGLLPIALYQPDFSALHTASSRIVVAGGTTSKGEFPQRTAVALAKRLGTPLIDFPGGHVGFISDPKEFAGVLQRVLT